MPQVWQVEEIIRLLSEQGYEEDIREWRIALKSGFDDGKTITIRYVGTTCAPNDPWKRMGCKPPLWP
jgi:hypothetical protein